MSDSTPTDSQTPRRLKSPFNGEAWIVPPDVSPELYEELVKRGYEPIPAVRKVTGRDRG